MREQDIQNSILEFLKYKGIFAWRQGNHSVYDKSTKTYRAKTRYEINGVSDILGILPSGQFLAIEVKTDKGRESEDQKSFIRKINASGGIAFVARSIEDVEKRIFND